eukprot:CCRYP_004289-RA/>CCRYP_004289-RA protein AED:0.28 eAED:0.28 QI:84/1/1/1/1/1/2/2306/691
MNSVTPTYSFLSKFSRFHHQHSRCGFLLTTLLVSGAHAFVPRPSLAAVHSSNPSFFQMTAHSTSTSASTRTIHVPPVPRRDEERVVYAGVLPPTAADRSLLRQANDSVEPLLDPPRPIPDPYGWLRDDERKDPEVIRHLEAENEYSRAVTSHLLPLQETLYKEFLSSIQETDYTTPRPRGDYWYYTRTYQGSSYNTYCRAPKTSSEFDAKGWDGNKEKSVLDGEVTYLDVNVLAEGKAFCDVGSVKVSPSHKYVAYSVDYLGDEKYELHVRNLESGEDVVLEKLHPDNHDAEQTCDEEKDTNLLEIDNFVWGKDDDTLYYVTMDEQHRPYRLFQRRNWHHSTPVDTLLKEEKDDLFWCSVSKSLDGEYIFFDMASKETSEVWFLATETESSSPEIKCVAPRRNKVLYEVEHGKGHWYIVTNVGNSPNMKLMTSPATHNSEDQWTLVLDSQNISIFDGSISKALDSVTVLNTHLVLEGREGGIPRVWLYEIESKISKRLEFDETAYDVGLGAHYESDATSVVVTYDSMLTPPSSIEIDLGDYDERKVLKAKAVPGYDKELFGCDRLEVPSRDGKTHIPVSIVYRRDTMDKVKSGESVPLHLYGYGSYGACIESDFGITRLPLLNRGMIYAIAHIRGGGEMGRQWYEEPCGGKYMCKKNTFNDFVDVARFFVEDRKWTTPEKLSCEGRSAGVS